jgi:hypothetical protein
MDSNRSHERLVFPQFRHYKLLDIITEPSADWKFAANAALRPGGRGRLHRGRERVFSSLVPPGNDNSRDGVKGHFYLRAWPWAFMMCFSLSVVTG